jgi:hypothetical protein
MYLIHGQNVAKGRYVDATKADPTLPSIEDDPQRYKERVGEKEMKIVADFKALPPVKIPLECDQATGAGH